jgi:hypothetical protein
MNGQPCNVEQLPAGPLLLDSACGKCKRRPRLTKNGWGVTGVVRPHSAQAIGPFPRWTSGSVPLSSAASQCQRPLLRCIPRPGTGENACDTC